MGKRVGPSKSGRASPRGTLTLCGLGIDRPEDATLGTIQALKESEVVFYIHGDGERLKPFLQTFCPDIRLFEKGKYDGLSDDQRIAIVGARVCAELEKGRKVVYATYGHPLLLSDGFNVMQYCRAKGHESRVLTAPSAPDNILAAIGDSAATFARGYLVCNAEHALGNAAILRKSYPLMLLCLDAVVARGQYGELCGRLESVYPPDHRILAVKCRDSIGAKVQIPGRVKDLRGWEKKIAHMMSLLVYP